MCANRKYTTEASSQDPQRTRSRATSQQTSTCGPTVSHTTSQSYLLKNRQTYSKRDKHVEKPTNMFKTTQTYSKRVKHAEMRQTYSKRNKHVEKPTNMLNNQQNRLQNSIKTTCHGTPATRNPSTNSEFQSTNLEIVRKNTRTRNSNLRTRNSKKNETKDNQIIIDTRLARQPQYPKVNLTTLNKCETGMVIDVTINEKKPHF